VVVVVGATVVVEVVVGATVLVVVVVVGATVVVVVVLVGATVVVVVVVVKLQHSFASISTQLPTLGLNLCKIKLPAITRPVPS
jgi:hypothetical protein